MSTRWLSHGLLLLTVVALPVLGLRGPHGFAPIGTAVAADTGSGRSAAWRGYILKPAVTLTTPSHRAPFVHTVVNGEVLGQIAAANGLRIDTLRQTNNLANVDSLQLGQLLLIPPTNGVLVQVAPGDTVVALADKYHVDPQVVVAYNDVRDPSHPVPGSLLMLPDGTGLMPATSAPGPAIASTPKQTAGRVTPPTGIGHGMAGHFPWGWCTYWVASHRSIPWSGDAWSWFGSAQRAGWATGQSPRAGAIMVTWESRAYGHVALVEAVYPDGSWDVSEMNYRGFGVVSHRHIGRGSVPLIGFIY